MFYALIVGCSYVFSYNGNYTLADTVESDNSDTISIFQRKQEYLKELKSITKDTAVQKIISFKPHFQDKYKNDPDYDYSRTKGGKTFWQKLMERLERLLEFLFGWEKNYKIAKTTKVAFRIICGIIVLIVLYVIVRVIMNHHGRWFFQRKNEDLDIDVNDLEKMIQYADFEKMISEAEANGNTRQSIRLYYLWLLRYLKEKKIIEWNLQKTNADYQNEIKDEVIKSKFTYLSYLYNYIWYGEFSISDNEYVNAKKAFLTYIKGNGNNE